MDKWCHCATVRYLCLYILCAGNGTDEDGDEVEMNSLIDGIFDDYDHHQLMRVDAQIYANLFIYIHSLILMRNVLLLKIMHNCLFTRIDIYIEMFVLLFCS